MDISVIIVNYNVRYFLEQALRSVYKASESLDVEVIVVDNHSTDRSVEMVRQQFPEVILILNDENVGFSKANNQGIKRAVGRYLLLLNPDTIIQEDSLNTVFSYMEEHSEFGAAGVRMIDGKGRYLPESKRGFPSPFVAFCKAFGLSALFPTSRLFNWYYLGHLDPSENWEIEVLCGAFMFIRSEVLEEVGGLDESFFMYGEDIDLSYRIKDAGYKIAYVADTSIIHFKGESTQKTSTVYIRRFYDAMNIFARKHFSKRGATLIGWLFSLAIYFRAGITLIKTVIKQSQWIVLDLILMSGIIWGTKELWALLYHGNPDHYPEYFMYTNVPLYVGIWFVAHYLSGGYDLHFKMNRLFRGHLIGTIFLLAVYGLLPEGWRTSRAIILLSAALTWGGLWATKTLKRYLFKRESGRDGHRNIALVSSLDATKRIKRLLDRANVEYEIVGVLAPQPVTLSTDYATDIGNLPDYARTASIDEIIFNADEISMQAIMDLMGQIDRSIDIKIVSSEGEGIVGSSSIHTSGELYAMQLHYRLSDPVYRRYKRIFDLGICLGMLICIPLWPWINRLLIQNWISVFLGRKTWVGYFDSDEKVDELPDLRQAVFAMESRPPPDRHRLNTLYARDYYLGWDYNRICEVFFKK